MLSHLLQVSLAESTGSSPLGTFSTRTKGYLTCAPEPSASEYDPYHQSGASGGPEAWLPWGPQVGTVQTTEILY